MIQPQLGLGMMAFTTAAAGPRPPTPNAREEGYEEGPEANVRSWNTSWVLARRVSSR